MVDVVNYYANKSIFITGVTGFIGKVLLEKLLRTCPDLKTVYLLVRKKKGQTADQRLRNIANCQLFEKLLKMNPNALDKVKLISGELLEEGLGLSAEDLEELQRECQILINNAACVSFNLPLKEALHINVVGVQKMLALADTVKNLEAFVQVSTSYCHDELEVVDEKVYPAPHSPEKIIDLVSWMNDETLEMIEKKIITPFPNTYGYTKCLAEQLIVNHNAPYPVVIARPSVVIPTYKDPVPGWVDNINGPNGIMYAASRGVLHTVYSSDSMKADTMPVDIVVNALIILACLTGIEKPKDVRVCNITQSGVNALTWHEGYHLWSEHLKKYPLSKFLWYPTAKPKSYKWEHNFDAFFEHTLPAYFVDLLLYLFGQKTFMISAYRRLKAGLELIQYYSNKEFFFSNEYYQSLKNRITKKDNDIFFTNLQEINPKDFMENYVKGMRKYYCKEDPSTLPQARKLLNIMYILHIILVGSVYASCLYLFYRTYNALTQYFV